MWPDFNRAIGEIQPTVVLVENVPNLLRLGIDEILDDMGAKAYATQAFIIPASASGSWHNRDRIWIIAVKENSLHSYSDRIGSYRERVHEHRGGEWGIELRDQQIRHIESMVSEGIRKGLDTRVFGDFDGVPDRVDRLKSIGNAVSPIIVYNIYMGIQMLFDNEINQNTSCGI